MLKLCFELQHSDKVLSIWDDIRWIHAESFKSNENNTVSYQMLLKCCIKAPTVEISKCLQVLSWMEQAQAQFIVHISFITKLIAKCGNNHDALQEIVHFMQKRVINNSNPKNEVVIKTALINAYGICSDIQSAKDIFNTIDEEQLNVVCIGAMMNALISNYLNEEAIELYDTYEKYESLNNYVTQMKALKACSNIGDYERGLEIIEEGMDIHNIKLKSALIDFYGKSGNVDMAINTFDSIEDPNKDIIHCNSMITAYIDNQRYLDALELYDNINAFNGKIQRDNITHTLALKACTALKDLDKGKRIHAANAKNASIAFQNTLINFYGTCGQIEEAQKVFYSMGNAMRNVVSINAMMTALVHNKRYQQVLKLYNDSYYLMDDISHVMALKACIGINDQKQGQQIISKLDKINANPQLISTVIDFHGHFGNINAAEEVFRSINDETKSIVNICAMMNIYIENEQNEKALELYDYIDSNRKDETCHMLAIKACINLTQFERAKTIHSEIATLLTSNNDIHLMTTLIHLYGDTLDIDTAIDIFSRIPDKLKGLITIGAMMDAYCKSNLNQECIDLFKSLPSLNINPDVLCYALLFTACTNGTDYHYGSQIHDELKNSKHLKWMLKAHEIQTNLVNMYGKCGMLDKCQEIFDEIKQKEYDKYQTYIEIWNSMIRAYGRNNYIDKSMELYHKMKNEIRVKPDKNTYKILLNACSHSGDDELARRIWMKEIKDVDIKYDVYVMTAFIDCISRKGYITEAFEYMMKYRKVTNNKLEDEAMYTALIAGCKKHDNLLIAQSVHNEMTKKFPNNSKFMHSVSVMLQSMYSNRT